MSGAECTSEERAYSYTFYLSRFWFLACSGAFDSALALWPAASAAQSMRDVFKKEEVK